MKSIVTAIFTSLLLSNPAAASRRLVYMREGPATKSIVLADSDGRELRTLDLGEGSSLYPTIAADGDRVAFSHTTNGRDFALFLVDLATNEHQQLTPFDGLTLHADFSGDGRRLAVSGPFGPRRANTIAWADISQAAAPAASRKEQGLKALDWHVLDSGGGPAYFPSLSSDGTMIVFHRSSSNQEDPLQYDQHLSAPLRQSEIVLVDLGANTTTVISAPDTISMSPSFSWDDRYVAFTQLVNGDWDIMIADLTQLSRAVTRIRLGPSRDLAPRFEHDGSLLLSSDRSGNFALYRIPAAELWRPEPQVLPLAHDRNHSVYAPQASGPLDVVQGKKADLPQPARSSFAAVSDGTSLYVTGGHQGSEHTYPEESFLKIHQKYDPTCDSWSSLKQRSTAAHGYESVYFNGFIYTFGGFAFDETHGRPRWRSLDLIERYDTKHDTWEVIGHLQQPRSSNIAARVGDKVYVLAGWDSTPRFEGDFEGRFHRSIEVFDLVTHQTSVLGVELPDPLRRALSAVTVEDTIILVGGLGQGSNHFDLLANVTVFDTEKRTFRELSPLPFPTFAPAAGLLNNSLYVFGGMFKTSGEDYKYVNHIYELPLDGGPWSHSGRYLAEPKGFARVLSNGPQSLAILGGHSADNQSDGPVASFETFTLDAQ